MQVPGMLTSDAHQGGHVSPWAQQSTAGYSEDACAADGPVHLSDLDPANQQQFLNAFGGFFCACFACGLRSRIFECACACF